MSNLRLGVNIDHIATLRNARGVRYPDPVHAAAIAEQLSRHCSCGLNLRHHCRRAGCEH